MITSEKGPSTGRVLLELAKDHLQLASLEWEFERRKWWRRLLVRGGGATILASAYLFFHLALVVALHDYGLTWVTIGVSVGFVYALVGSALFWGLGRREPAAGEPFEGSREELRRSYHWIERLFF